MPIPVSGKAMLAREVLCAVSPRERWAIDRKGKAYPAGTDPEPGKALERILDRLTGKPRQTVKIEAEPVRSVVDISVDIAAMMVATPSLRAVVSAALAVEAGQPAALPPASVELVQPAESSDESEIHDPASPQSLDPACVKQLADPSTQGVIMR